MHKILEKRQYSPEVFYLKVEAPEIAKNRYPGQFVIVQIDTDFGERVPLTIADANANEGWIALVIQAVGATTIKLCSKNVGDCIAAILGPLGRPSHITKCGTVACVCGGIGALRCILSLKRSKIAETNLLLLSEQEIRIWSFLKTR